MFLQSLASLPCMDKKNLDNCPKDGERHGWSGGVSRRDVSYYCDEISRLGGDVGGVVHRAPQIESTMSFTKDRVTQ